MAAKNRTEASRSTNGAAGVPTHPSVTTRARRGRLEAGIRRAVCDHYSKLATSLHPDLPKELSRLAWLGLDTQEGREYWDAMELMGKYAAANHALVHRHIAANLGVEVMLDIENHHNFAWKEQHFGKDVVVHRKGATPAAAGVLGIIPGSMAAPGFLVRGKGNKDSLNSASHGAGRRMSRKKATETLSWSDANQTLRQRGVIPPIQKISTQ